jgi:hypothetical protein
MSILSKLETDRATRVPFAPSVNIPQTDVQRAVEAVLTAANAAVAAVAADLAAHIADPTAAHAASAISFSPTGGIASTDVQAALAELDTEKLNASAYTAADVLAKLLTVDGSGSGLDADLLDGQSSAAFALSARNLTAGAGLTGGGTLAADRTFDVGAGTGITVAADSVGLDTASTRNTDHAGVSITAGNGLTGGGDITANRTLDVGGSTSIIVGSNDVQRAALTGAIAASQDSNATTATIDLVVSMGGASLATGIVKGADVHADFAFTIVQWTLLADASGSLVVDIWKDTYANYPPTVADTITASAKPTISAATKGQSSTLTGWTTNVAAGDVLRFNVDSVSGIAAATLILKVTKTS